MEGMEGREQDLICRIEGKLPSHTRTTASSLPFSPGRLGYFLRVAASASIGSTALWRTISNIILYGRHGRKGRGLVCRIEGKPPSHTKTTASTLPFSPGRLVFF
jgi:hypothetical protein